MAKSIIWRTRIRRFLFYFSGSYLAVVSAVLIPAFGIWRETQSPQSPSHQNIIYWLIAGVLLGVFFIVLRNYLEYQRVKYDPHWAMNFQDRFDVLLQARAKAEVLLKNRVELANIDNPCLAEIDDVLDFLEDIGLYQRADHISPELAHHHFFHWTRIYWQAAKPYVQAWRKKEPARWNHVEELFETSCDIELKEHGGSRDQLLLGESELDKYLRQETQHKEEQASNG